MDAHEIRGLLIDVRAGRWDSTLWRLAYWYNQA